MKIFVSGGTGFVGRHVCDFLLKQGHHVIAVGTSAVHPFEGRTGFQFMTGNTIYEGKWQAGLKETDAVINLAGRTIFHYWTGAYKKQMYDSRVLTTRNIVNALPMDRSMIFLSTSAAGYYGDRGDDALDESAGVGDDFLATLCRDWEKEAMRAGEQGARVVLMRFGVVLGKDGGALAKMIPAFRYLAGGPLGDGRQWFPWIHMDDLVGAACFLLEHGEIDGAVNFCAPGAVRQKDFAKALGGALHRPSFLRTPAFMLRLIMGELGASLLESQRAVPGRLRDEGFDFQYPDIESALRHLV